ncbi:MAG: hypothetical protein ABFS38_16010 [Bacteroidota bacterium]
MNDSDKNSFQPVNDPIKPHSQVTSCIQIPEFEKMVSKGEISKIQVFFERIAQEIYNTRKKNYTWGFGVIEPEFHNFSDRIILVSKLYKEEKLADLNSVIFKLFSEFNNLILSTALHMHIPIRGMIRIADTYHGTVQSKKPALVSGNDPLILSDLLKAFSIDEIFPNGFSDGMIPAVDMPYHFGGSFCKSLKELSTLESIGIFMPAEETKDTVADVTILSNMIVETEIEGKKIFACNWKEWMSEHSACSAENILAFAEAEAGNAASPFAKSWQSLISYSAHL